MASQPTGHLTGTIILLLLVRLFHFHLFPLPSPHSSLSNSIDVYVHILRSHPCLSIPPSLPASSSQHRATILICRRTTRFTYNVAANGCTPGRSFALKPLILSPSGLSSLSLPHSRRLCLSVCKHACAYFPAAGLEFLQAALPSLQAGAWTS